MIFHHDAKNIKEKLREEEKAELETYCKEQGFTKEQTEIFVKNSLANTDDVYLGE